MKKKLQTLDGSFKAKASRPSCCRSVEKESGWYKLESARGTLLKKPHPSSELSGTLH